MNEKTPIASATPQSDDPFEGVISFIEHGLRTNGTNASDWRSDMESVLDVLRALRRSAERGAQLDACFRELEELRARVASKGAAVAAPVAEDDTPMRYEREEMQEIEKALRDLSMVLGNPAMNVASPHSIESELIQYAVQRLSPLTNNAPPQAPSNGGHTTGDSGVPRPAAGAPHSGGSNPQPTRDRDTGELRDDLQEIADEVYTRVYISMKNHGAFLPGCDTTDKALAVIEKWVEAHRVPTSATGCVLRDLGGDGCPPLSTVASGSLSDTPTEQEIDRALAARIPGGSSAEDWFLPHKSEKARENVRDVVAHMLAAGRRLSAIHVGWVPVGERLPEKGQHVLICGDGFGPMVSEFNTWKEQPAGPAVGGYVELGPWFLDPLDDPTHWQPLPTPPDSTSREKP